MGFLRIISDDLEDYLYEITRKIVGYLPHVPVVGTTNQPGARFAPTLVFLQSEHDCPAKEQCLTTLH